ncbi:MAG: glycosyltransferase, partial [Rhodoferax sp.]|nr:glycosyltransferase [Rhodoferax sp.]
MNIHHIPVVTVSYNAPDLILNLLTSFRNFYPNTYYIVDGSDPEPAAKIREIVAGFSNVQLIEFGYNIHHGPGLSWAINNLPLNGPTLFLDSDISLLHAGVIESLQAALQPQHYGVGGVAYINRSGYDVPQGPDAIAYLHPGIMLCNMDVVKQWPLPIKHGAPMVETMLALHDAQASDLLVNMDWVLNDVRMGSTKIFVDHKGQGTVQRTGGYHLEEWQEKMESAQSKRPAYSTEVGGYNQDLLSLIPASSSALMEVGCDTGGLARAFKASNPGCTYHGIELDSHAAELARQNCNTVLQLDIESVDASFFKRYAGVNCWIFGDVLE